MHFLSCACLLACFVLSLTAANDPNTDHALNSGLNEGVFGGGKPGPAVVNTEQLGQSLSEYIPPRHQQLLKHAPLIISRFVSLFLLFCSLFNPSGREELAKRSAELNK